MKKINKIMTVLFAVLAVFGLATKASADGLTDGDILINGTTEGEIYNLYKIFDLTYNGDKVSYTIDSEWTNFFIGDEGDEAPGAKYIVASVPEGKTLNPITVGTTTKYINITESNIAEFAKDALAYTKTAPKDATGTANGETLTVNVKDKGLGYYLVYNGGTEQKSDYSTLVSLTSTTPSATVNVKATFPEIDKVINVGTGLTAKDVEVGEVVPFKITGNVPDTTGYTTYIYTITDTMTSGLDYLEDSETTPVVVKIGEKTLAKGTEYTLTESGNGFVLTITSDEILASTTGAKIEVTYSGKVTAAAVNTITTNTANLTYSNDPKNSASTAKTPDEVVYVYTTSLTLKKVDGETALADATFVLKNKDRLYYSYDSSKQEVSWVELANAKKLTTDATGFISTILGLEVGTYELVEIEHPAGYNLLPNPVKVTITRDKDTFKLALASDNKTESATIAVAEVTETNTTDVLTVNVPNISGTTLPTTGGIGTKLFITIGGLLAMAAAVILVTNKQIEKEEM